MSDHDEHAAFVDEARKESSGSHSCWALGKLWGAILKHMEWAGTR